MVRMITIAVFGVASAWSSGALNGPIHAMHLPQSLEMPYRNCAVARAVGAAPVRRGDPGYGPWLDRDGDGVGCERYW